MMMIPSQIIWEREFCNFFILKFSAQFILALQVLEQLTLQIGILRVGLGDMNVVKSNIYRNVRLLMINELNQL